MDISKFFIVAPTEREWWYALGAYWNMEIFSAHNIGRDPCSFSWFDRVKSWKEAIEYVNEHDITAFVASCDVRLRRDWIWCSIRKVVGLISDNLIVVGGGFDSVKAVIVNKEGARLLLDSSVTPPDISQMREEDGISIFRDPLVESHEFRESKWSVR